LNAPVVCTELSINRQIIGSDSVEDLAISGVTLEVF